MNRAILAALREIAETVSDPQANWLWRRADGHLGMFGISEARAKEYAATYGGRAEPQGDLT